MIFLIIILIILSSYAFIYFKKADSEMEKALEELGKALDKMEDLKDDPLDK